MSRWFVGCKTVTEGERGRGSEAEKLVDDVNGMQREEGEKRGSLTSSRMTT
jgi:hypothetical protein